MTWYRLLSVLGLIASATVLFFSFRLRPDERGYGTHEQIGLPPCGFLRDHGVPCISCGMTTAFVAMAHARPGLALRSNPFGVLLFLGIAAAPFYLVHALVKGLDPFWLFRTRRAMVLLPLCGLLLLVNWGVMVLIAKAG